MSALRSLLALLVLSLFALSASAAPPTATSLHPVGTVALASAARTAGASSSYYVAPKSGSVLIVVDTTAITATPTHSFFVDVYDPGTDAATSLTGTTQLFDATAVGVQRAGIGPGNQPTASCGQTICLGVPVVGLFRIRSVHGDADEITYSVSIIPAP